MAFISQEKKKLINEKIKILNKEFGVKTTLSIRDNSVLILKVKSRQLDFTKNIDYNKRGGQKRFVYKEANDYYKKAMDILNSYNHDNSDPMYDHYDVGYYVRIIINNDEE